MAHPAARRTKARTREASLRVGCSGWSYAEWRGTVYPAGAASATWFEHYAQRFDTVEINNTFYRLPSEATVRAWQSQAPDAFHYAVKVGQYGSHRRKLRDPTSWLTTHIDRMKSLASSLGPQLVQLPPHWHRDVGRLDAFLEAAPRDWRWAVEVRDPTWLDDAVYAVLAAHGAALCIHDLIGDHPWVLTAPWTYVRFHGPQASAHTGRYGAHRMRSAANRLERWLADGTDVYAYFNNDRGGAAPADAAWLRQRLS